MPIEVVEGDITKLDVDAIVNAANDTLAPGGGVCGAIHRAAGPELAQECAAIGHCPVGGARITKGYRLPARHVIHAVGPVWHGGGMGEEELLRLAYHNSLELAADHHLTSIAFPAISTGIYGFPPERAAKIAVKTCAEFLEDESSVEQIVLCCFGAESARLHREALAEIDGS